MDHYPKDLLEKVTSLNEFKNWFESKSSSSEIIPPNSEQENNKGNNEENEDKEENENDKPFTYVEEWVRNSISIRFRLTNKILQVCFLDNTEIILSSENRGVTYCNKERERMIYPLSTALSNYKITRILKFIKYMLTKIVNKKI